MENNLINLLYIDDNIGDIHLLKTYIESYNIPFKLDAYVCSKKALDFLFDNYKTIDVILLDFCLTGEDIFEILALIKNDERTKHIPLIIFSNWNNIEDRDKCFNYKANDFAVKPNGFDDYSDICQIIIKYRTKNTSYSKEPK